ncbi:MAG: hypothetical protein HGA67_00910 [Candidatus Yonathbacteria bacterium]|nr:hypothetical protein [Candidatus Yonathbacteria bacterium]
MLRAFIAKEPRVTFVGYSVVPLAGATSGQEEKTCAVFLEGQYYFFCTKSELQDETFFLVDGNAEPRTLLWGIRQKALREWPKNEMFIAPTPTQQSQGIIPVFRKSTLCSEAYILQVEIPFRLICAPREEVSA